MTQEMIQDKCRSSLIGGAVGDVLGYEVEFISLSAIRKKYGEKGIVKAGNMIGAILGYSAIPQKYLTTLEIHN